MSYDWPAMSGAQHLVWSALAAAGLGWFIRRRSHRWLGLVPLVLVSLAHANYNAAHSLSGMAWASPVLSWIELRLTGLLLVTLVVLVVADRVGLAGARRSRPELLLRGERSDGLGPWPLVKVAVRGAPWSTFVGWQVVLERRAALNAQLAGVAPPEFALEVEQRITQLQKPTDRAQWAGAAKQVVGSLSLRGLRSWRTLLWVLSVAPALLFLVVGGWPATRGLQEIAGTWFGTGLMLVGLTLGWVLLAARLPALVRQLRQQSEPSLHELKIRPAFRLAAGGASLVAAALVVVALVMGGDPTRRVVTNLGATLVSHALLNAASGSGTSGGGGSSGSGAQQGPPRSSGVTGEPVPTPQVSSPKLQNLVNNLYKGTTNPNRVGNGTTMDAIRKELSTGAPTGKRFHTVKGRETLQGLKNWLRHNPDAPVGDRHVAQELIDDLIRALKGKRWPLRRGLSIT